MYYDSILERPAAVFVKGLSAPPTKVVLTWWVRILPGTAYVTELPLCYLASLDSVSG